MGKCSKCGNKILYNAFKKIKGVIYCLKCAPEERISKKLADTVTDAKLSFGEFEDAMKEVALVVVNEEALKPCKYCGAKNSSDWLVLSNGERVCKRRACRKKAETGD